MTQTEFSRRVKYSGYPREMLAGFIGGSRQYVSNLANRRRGVPFPPHSVRIFLRLCKMLRVDPLSLENL